MRPRMLQVMAVLFAVFAGSLFQVAHARPTDALKVSARIHFSSNFEGELEPCG
jgi:hypothetical protein